MKDVLNCLVKYARLKSMIYESASLLIYSQQASIRLDHRIPSIIKELEDLEKDLDENFNCSSESYIKYYGLINYYYTLGLDILREVVEQW